MWVELNPTCSGVALQRLSLRPSAPLDEVVDVGRIGSRPAFTSGPVADDDHGGATWSRDGRRVAFERSGAVRVVDARRGREVTRIADVDVSAAALSPDGAALAFWRDAGIRVMQVGDRALRTLVPMSADHVYLGAAWSPDGRTIAAVTEDRLDLVDVQTGAASTVPMPGNDLIHSPSWSPDGISLVAWTISRNRRKEQLVRIMSATGSVAPVPGAMSTVGLPVAWSPDGRLAFWRD